MKGDGRQHAMVRTPSSSLSCSKKPSESPPTNTTDAATGAPSKPTTNHSKFTGKGRPDARWSTCHLHPSKDKKKGSSSSKFRSLDHDEIHDHFHSENYGAYEYED